MLFARFVFLLLFVIACSQSSPLHAQRRSSVSAPIPSPRSVLGFSPGDDRTIADWNQITNYFARLDKASERVLVQTIGQSTLNRPIVAAFISARENILALNKYRQMQGWLADPRLVSTKLERDRLLRDGKVVVAISCSIHSTEIVASQMSMQLAYELATAQDADTREILQNTILILLPSANPDGVDIVANWYRKTLSTPYEGKEPPEIYHHYAGHDDNRDWFMLNLAETKAITRLFWKEWFPEIVYDIHQQGTSGSRFFIPPFYDPPNPHIAPLLLRQVGLIGHKIAADLQAAEYKGVLTNAVYDTWWHGGFRTAPYFHNSIGILSEAASARLMTPAIVTRDQLSRMTIRGLRSALEPATNFPDPWLGGTWHARDIAAMEMTAIRAVLSLAAKYRFGYLRDFFELGRRNVKEDTQPGEPVAYLIPAGQGHDEAVAKFIGTLFAQGVEVHRLDAELHAFFGPQVLQRTNSSSEKLGTFRRIIAQTTEMHEVPAGSYVVFLSQPQRSNILALFEPQIYPDRLNALGEAERPYDVTGWTLPLQMGVEVSAVTEIRESAAERRLKLVESEAEVRQGFGLAEPIASPVKLPLRIAVYKSWMGNIDEGWTRFVFDTFAVPYKSILDTDIRKEDLSSQYDVVILPSQPTKEILEGNPAGSYPAEFTGGITPAGVSNLQRFVDAGGTLICFDASCDLAIKSFDLPLRNPLESLKTSEFYCPGSILSLEVNNRHPIARRMPPTVNAYFINSSAFETTDPNVQVIARYAKEDVLRSGWLLGEDRIKGRIALAEVHLGKGRVVLFGFRPQHRGQTWATFPFIWNYIGSRTD